MPLDMPAQASANRALEAITALDNPLRLALFRLLVREGPAAQSAGALAQHLDVPPSTLSSHLAQLERARLLRAWKVDRRVFYAADLDGLKALLGFLFEDCGNGHPEVRSHLSNLLSVPRPDAGHTTPASSPFERRSEMSDNPYNVLFLCTSNTARSQIAESILNRLGQGRFKGFSAGSHPAESVHPATLALLQKLNYPTEGLHPKTWEDFAAADAPELDFVFTVCDRAAQESCPAWPGQPMTAHWGVPDPAAAEGSDSEKALAFSEAYRMLNNRISIFVSLPLVALDKLALQKRLEEIGRSKPMAEAG